MGSLMAGWDSPVSGPKDVRFQRNKSLTKGEIDAYWRSKKRTEEEHLRALSELLQNSDQESIYEESGPQFRRSSSLPLNDRKESFLMSDSETDLEIKKRNDWWTRSNWAFLNEPPVTAMEGPSYKYASQYHVASLGNQKPGIQSQLTT